MANEQQPEVGQDGMEPEQPRADVAPEQGAQANPASGADAGEPEPEAFEEAAEPLSAEEAAQLQEEVAAARDTVLRAQAEMQNTKRRAEQDVEKARKFALEGFARELLPVVDNLERALESAAGDDEAIKPIAEGVELTLKSFLDALRKFHVEIVDPQGEPFDPELHQALSSVENPEVEPNNVVAVMQKGYTLNGRLVRPALVMVSKSAQG